MKLTLPAVGLAALAAAMLVALAGCSAAADTSDTPPWPEVRPDGTGEAAGFISTVDYQPIEPGRWEGFIELVPTIEETAGARFYVEVSSYYVSPDDPTHRATLEEAFEFLFRRLVSEDAFLVRFHEDADRYVIDELVPQTEWGDAFFTAGPIPEAPPPDLDVPVLDDQGRSPIDAASEYFEAVASGNPEAIWTAYSPSGAPADFEHWLAEWETTPSTYQDVDFLEQRVLSEDSAIVRVAYQVESGGQVVEIGWPGEWWRVEKVDGRWYLGWLPRQ